MLSQQRCWRSWLVLSPLLLLHIYFSDNMEKEKTIALIAHDEKKAEMIEFVKRNYDILKKFNLVATGTTGSRIIETGLQVERKLSGPNGGDAQIAAMVAEGLLSAVLFFKDPLGRHPHEPDIQMLMRICDVHNIALATNPNAAELILLGLEATLQSDSIL